MSAGVQRTLVLLLFAVGGSALLATPASAQLGGGDGYLFREPRASLAWRVGVARPSANSQVFDFTEQQLTVNRGDFTGASVAMDLDVSLTRRLALRLGAALSRREARSEYRNYVDNSDQPIEQATQFQRVPLTIGLKYSLTNPGRSVGRYAWVPAKVVPYVAAGTGLMFYRFRQTGDFVDFRDLAVFNAELFSSGTSAMGYGAVGVNYALSSRLGLTTEARYERANGPLGSDFEGFDHIDLSGVAVTAGFHVRF